MRSWFAVLVRSTALLSCLLGLIPSANAQTHICAVNGATGANAAQGCTVAQVGWRAGSLPPPQSLQVFPSEGDAQQAVAGYLAQGCPNCNRGLLFTDLVVPPGASCNGQAACYGGYTQNYAFPYQNIEGFVVIWGFGYQAGNPPIPTYYSSGNAASTVNAVGLCAVGQTNYLDYAPDGSLVYMCAPPTNLSPAPAAVVPTMTSLDSTDNGVCRTCQGASVPLGTKQGYAQDYTSASPDGIDLSRYYNSARGTWTFNYDRSITHTVDSTNQVAYATLTRPDGSALNFKASTAPTAQAATANALRARSAVTAALASGSYAWTSNNDNGTNQTFIAPLTDTKDSSGAITGFDYHNLHDEDEHYDATGRLTSITARSGNALTFTYDGSNRLSRIDDAFGRHLTLNYTTVTSSGSNTWDDGQGGTVVNGYTYYPTSGDWQNASLLTSVSDGSQTVSYAYTTLTGGNAPIAALTQVTYPDATTRHYSYDNSLGLLQSVTDESGVAFENYTYSGAAGHALYSSGHVGNVDKVIYNSAGMDMSLTDAANRTFNFESGGVYQGVTPITYQSAPCTVCSGVDTYLARAVYDLYGNQTSRTDFNGNVTTRVFDTARGLPTSITEASGSAQARTTTITWDPAFRLPDEVVEPIAVGGATGTRTTDVAYDAHGNPLTLTVTASVGGTSSARTWSFTYNGQGQTLTATGPRTDLTATSTYTYDTPSGNLLSASDPLNHSTTFSNYTPQGLVGQAVDPNGLVTTYAYDARNRLTDVQRGSSATHWEAWHIAYAPTGLITQVTRPNGSRIGYVYDTSHRLTEIDDLDESGTVQGRLVYTLDNASEVTATTLYDATGTVVGSSSATYDAYGRLHQAIGAANQTTTYGYDTQGNLTGVTDARNHSSSATYDALNRLNQTTNALSGVANLAHDVADNLTGAQDVRGNRTTYAFDGFDEVVGVTSPDTGSTALTRDEDGNVTHAVDASGRTTDTTYDALDRPTQAVFSHGGTVTQTQTFTYDSCPNGIGRLCGFTDGSGSTSYAYDLWGRVTSKTQVVGSGSASRSFTVGYAYDSAGQPVGMTYPSAQGLTHGFRDNRPVALSLGGTALLSGASYLPFGGDVQGWTWAVDGSTVTYAHDLDQQVTQVTDTDTRAYAYDPNGNVMGVTDPTTLGYAQAYTYDALNRLTVGTVPAVAATYGYDANANRTSAQQGATTYSFTVDPASNRYTAVGSTTVVTDATGNLTSDGTNAYTFDDTGRMASSTNAAGLVTAYAYNALGQRVSKTSTSGTTYFVDDEAGHLIGTYDASAVPIEEIVYLEDRPVADLRGGTTYRVLTDPLTTPRKLIDASNATVWSWDGKEAFGNTAPTGSLTFNLRFPGQYADVETGLVNNGFRDYAPAWGRYVESDPIGLNGGWNTYGYVEGNPMNGTDSTGQVIAVQGSGLVDANLAIMYLEKSPTFHSMMRQLELSPTLYTIHAIGGAEENSIMDQWAAFNAKYPNNLKERPGDEFSSSSNTVKWFSHESASCASGVYSSPAIALAHELGHAAQKNAHPFFRNLMSQRYSSYVLPLPLSFLTNEIFDNTEEMRNILFTEDPIAIELGEPVRLSHHSDIEYVAHPTDRFNPSSPKLQRAPE